jgi:fimbrial isopeptide formation D2 family protein/uncharacterized repeat protein (TIGR01451 family)
MTLLALEPRLMFDGAGLMTAEVGRAADGSLGTLDTAAPQPRALAPATPQDAWTPREPTASRTTDRSHELLFVDARVPDAAVLVDGLRDSIEVHRIDPSRDGLAQIAQVLSTRSAHVSAIHVVSHGSSGQLLIGATAVDTAALAAYRGTLEAIGAGLSSGGDLLLYGCEIGAGDSGDAFLRALAAATGADVAASDDRTGASVLGGDWQLEATAGSVETASALRMSFDGAWEHLLAGAPSVSLSTADRSVLLGETFRIDATFDNVGASPGYGPYVDLFIPSRGADGGAAPDGITVSGASYLGRPLNVTQVTLTDADVSAGSVAHPYARDSAGGNRVAIPGGFVAGDRLVVIEMPFGSYTADQPPSTIQIDARLSPLADVGTPLQLVARAGFRFGNDALDNPSSDPTTQSGTVALSVDPAVYRLTTTYIGPEDETATGPNYVRAYRVDVDIAEGQTLTSIDLSTALDPAMQFTALSGTPASVGGTSIGASPAGGWRNVDGVLVSGAATGTSAPATPGGTVTRTLLSATGTAATQDASMVVGFHVPLRDADAVPVIGAASGDKVELVLGVGMDADWRPLDGRDPAQSFTERDPDAHRLEADSIAIQKLRALEVDARAPGLGPGDRLAYALDVQVSDFFAFADGATPLQVVDTLSDGLEMIDASMGAFANPVLTVSRSGGASERYTLVRGTHYTVTTLGDGRQRLVFDLGAALPAGAGQLLVGDLFDGDSTRNGPTTARLSFGARVLDSYRVGPPAEAGGTLPGATHLPLNEGDRLVNAATVEGTVLDRSLDPSRPGLQGELEDTLNVAVIEANRVSIDIVGRNGVAVVNDPADPVRVAPRDTVSYQIEYVVPTGDFENFSLAAYLPLPIFSTADPERDGTPSAFTLAAGPYDPTPAVGRFSYEATGADGRGVSLPSATTLADANGVRFDFGDRSDSTDLPLTIRVSFTVTAGDQPFADGLFLTAQAQAEGENTAGEPIRSQSIDLLRVVQPVLDLQKGVVQDDVQRPTSIFDPSYSPGDPRALVRAPGDAAGVALTGRLDTGNAGRLDTDIANVDAADTLRFAIVVQNLGSSERGAFDLTLRDQLPAGVDPASVANLRITYGDGRAVYDGSPASLARLVRGDGAALGSEAAAIAALFGANGLQLVDGAGADGVTGTLDDVGALGGTQDAQGRPQPAGSNVLVVTYDARLTSAVEAGARLTSSATLTRYAGTEGGADFTPVDLVDAAAVTIALPALDKRLVATSEPDAATVGTDVVIGERVTYEVVVAVPEGTTTGARFVDTLTPGLSFVSVDAIEASGGTRFASGLPTPAAATVTSAGGDANRLTILFGDIVNDDTDNATPQTITVRYTAVVDNAAPNQQDQRQGNTVELVSVAGTATDSAPELRIVEPALTVDLSSPTVLPDAGDVVTYTVTITAAAGRPPANEVDLEVINPVPADLVYIAGSLSQVSGPPAGSLAFAGPGIVGSWSGLAPGEQVVLTFQARLGDQVAIGDRYDQTANVRWSSLPGTANADLSPVATTGDFERSGDVTDPGGALNDYRATDPGTVVVTSQLPVLTLVASSESGSVGATVVPGEVLRYRMVVQLPEGTAAAAEIRPILPPGLRFVNDGTTTIAFVANAAGIDSSSLAGPQFDLAGGGADAAAIAALAPLRVLPGSAIVDATGSPIAPGTVMVAGTAPRLLLGDLDNADRDADKEFVVIEFDAIVDNAVVGNVAGATLDTVFDWRAEGVLQGTSNRVDVALGEPSIVDLDKRIVAVEGERVTFEAVFSNTGTQTAFDVRLFDGFGGAAGIAFAGPAGVTGLPPGATDASVADALDIRIPSLAPGQSVTIRYVAVVDPAAATVPSRDAVVVYTSLSPGGESLPVATSNGAALTPTTGERTGETSDYGGAVNTYRDADGAGLATLRGTLWDDTGTPDGAIGAGEARLPGVRVTATSAGRDGLFGTSDDVTQATTTDAAGGYRFVAVPEGPVRIVAPTPLVDTRLGELLARVDVQGDPTDATIALTVLAGRPESGLDIGYVQRNDPPTVTVPPAVTADEDVRTPIPVAVGDPDAGAAAIVRVTLDVLEGRLDATPSGGVVVTGNGSARLVLDGTLAGLGATLATLGYTGPADWHGTDRLQVRIDDLGHTGDADGDRMPGEPVDDNLSAIATVPITVRPVNDPPVARPDLRTTTEDVPITGAVITGTPEGDVRDTDVDGDPLTVQGVVPGTGAGPASGGLGTPIVTPFGALTMQPDGRYSYVPSVELPAGRSVQDVFTYTVSDGAGGTATTTLTIVITGVDDPVSASPDVRSMTERDPPIYGNAVAGPTGPGGAPGDAADIDPDGERLTVTAIAAVPGGTGAPVAGTVGAPIRGDWGVLTLLPDGRYGYATGPGLPTLAAGQSLVDVFRYSVTDGRNTATTTITITIVGVNDPPRAQPDANRVPADDPRPAVGNLIGGGSTQDRPDTDPDGDRLQVQGVVPGRPAEGVVTGGVDVPVPGEWGSLVVRPDGSYAYTVDPTRPGVIALRPGETLTDTFTYTVRDPGGQAATSTLTITVEGRNDPPTASDTLTRMDLQPPRTGPMPAVVPPAVSDPDNRPPELLVTVDGIDRPGAGTFLRPDGSPVRPGDRLTVGTLQQLSYRPDPTWAATPLPGGDLPGGSLRYTVADPTGASAPGRLDIVLVPPRAVPPAPPIAPYPPGPPALDLVTGGPGPGGLPGTPPGSIVPAADRPLIAAFDDSPLGRPLSPSPTSPSSTLVDRPIGTPVADTVREIAELPGRGTGPIPSEAAMLAPYSFGPMTSSMLAGNSPGEIVRPVVVDTRERTSTDIARLEAEPGRLDLDAGGLFPSNRIGKSFGDERIGPTRGWTPLAPEAVAPAPAPAPAPAASPKALGPDDDCEPAPQPKPKPKPVKRVLPDAVSRPAPTFTEQLGEQKKKLKLPPKVAPKTPPARQC